MADFADIASEREQLEREIALRACVVSPQRDFEAEVCHGCQFVTKTSYGRSCEVWKDCVEDVRRREKA